MFHRTEGRSRKLCSNIVENTINRISQRRCVLEATSHICICATTRENPKNHLVVAVVGLHCQHLSLGVWRLAQCSMLPAITSLSPAVVTTSSYLPFRCAIFDIAQPWTSITGGPCATSASRCISHRKTWYSPAFVNLAKVLDTRAASTVMYLGLFVRRFPCYDPGTRGAADEGVLLREIF